MATVNQAVVNPLLDASAKARGHLTVTRRKVANKVTHSFLSMSAFSLSLLLFFEVYTRWHGPRKWNYTGSIFLSQFFFSWTRYIYKSSMLLSILDISISPVLSCVPCTVINTNWERSSVFSAYVPTKPPCCPSICNGSDEPICKHM